MPCKLELYTEIFCCLFANGAPAEQGCQDREEEEEEAGGPGPPGCVAGLIPAAEDALEAVAGGVAGLGHAQAVLGLPVQEAWPQHAGLCHGGVGLVGWKKKRKKMRMRGNRAQSEGLMK